MYRRSLKNILYIVVHHSVTRENATVEDIRRMHENIGYSDIGYHFLVNKNGLQIGRPILFNGAHALSEKSKIKMNHHGIGLCIIGNFEYKAPDDKLVNETAYAIKRLCEKYNINLDRDHIIPHYQVDYTACPGKFTMGKIYKKLKI